MSTSRLAMLYWMLRPCRSRTSTFMPSSSDCSIFSWLNAAWYSARIDDLMLDASMAICLSISSICPLSCSIVG